MGRSSGYDNAGPLAPVGRVEPAKGVAAQISDPSRCEPIRASAARTETVDSPPGRGMISAFGDPLCRFSIAVSPTPALAERCGISLAPIAATERCPRAPRLSSLSRCAPKEPWDASRARDRGPAGPPAFVLEGGGCRVAIGYHLGFSLEQRQLEQATTVIGTITPGHEGGAGSPPPRRPSGNEHCSSALGKVAPRAATAMTGL